MLADRHAAFLAARAVTGSVVERRGYATVTDPDELFWAGFPLEQARLLGSGLLIPRYGLDGRPTWPKFRPDLEGRNGPVVNRAGHEIKYASPGGSWNFLDVLPGTILAGDIWVSAEGFVKADAMTAAGGFPVVAFDGVWGWRSQGGPLLGLETLVRPGRWFHVVCDSDYRTNWRVAGAMCALAKWLRSEGAKVRILHPPGEEKVGVDDFLAAGGHLSQLVEAGRPTSAVRQAWTLRKFSAAWGAR